MTPATLSSVTSSAVNAVSSGIQRIREGLSFAHVLSQSPVKETLAAADSPPAASAANDLQKQLQAALGKFRDAVHRRFAGAGIDTSVPVQLQSDGLGGVSTDGRHPLQAIASPTLDGHSPQADSHFSVRLSGNEIQIGS